MTVKSPLSRGCQFGAMRYRADGSDTAVLGHCRMRPHPMGGPFGRMVSTMGLTVGGAPTWFRSSHAAKPGVCAQCGTPVFFRQESGDETWVTGGWRDDPSLTPRRNHDEAESKWDRADLCAHLPKDDTKDDIRYGGRTGQTGPVTACQHNAMGAA